MGSFGAFTALRRSSVIANWYVARPPRPSERDRIIAWGFLNQVDALVVKMLAGGPTICELQRLTDSGRGILATMYGTLENGTDVALFIACTYDQVDGELHKDWVTDQMVRALLGSDYVQFVLEYAVEVEGEWRTGIAP